jgi:predicted DNA-binding transcriptional regulator AlpA
MRQLLSKREAAERLGYHPEHLMRLSRLGAFPRPIKLGSAANCAVRFAADEIDAWVTAHIEARDREAS